MNKKGKKLFREAFGLGQCDGCKRTGSLTLAISMDYDDVLSLCKTCLVKEWDEVGHGAERELRRAFKKQEVKQAAWYKRQYPEVKKEMYKP